jgi:WD40 repeat protein
MNLARGTTRTIARRQSCMGGVARVWVPAAVLSTVATGSVGVGTPVLGRRVIMTRGGHPVLALAFGPHGDRLAVGSEDGSVRILRGPQWTIVTTLHGHREWVACAAFSPDGRSLATGGLGGEVLVWSTLTWRVVRSVRADDWAASDVAFAPDSRLMAVAGRSGGVTAYDTRGYAVVRRYLGHSSWANTVSFSPDGKLLASGGTDGNLILWDVRTARRTHVLKHPECINGARFGRTGDLLVSACDDGVVRLWDASSGRLIRALGRHADSAERAAFVGSRGDVVSCGLDGVVRLWRRNAPEVSGPRGAGAVALSSDPTGGYVASGDKKGAVTLWVVNGAGPVHRAGRRLGGEPRSTSRPSATARAACTMRRAGSSPSRTLAGT